MPTQSPSTTVVLDPELLPRARLARFAVAAAAAGMVLTGIVGLLHLPFAAPMLRKLSPASVCPVTRGTPEQIDLAHAISSGAIRRSATSVAPERPALGFHLDKTTKNDLRAWAAKHEVECASISGNENLQKCRDVPAIAVGQAAELGVLEEVTFEFHSSGGLVNVQTMRRGLSAAHAARAVAELERDVSSVLGAPSTVGGEPTAAHLSRGFLSSYVAAHGFVDYRATVSATNLAPTGIMVREEYVSAR